MASCILENGTRWTRPVLHLRQHGIQLEMNHFSTYTSLAQGSRAGYKGRRHSFGGYCLALTGGSERVRRLCGQVDRERKSQQTAPASCGTWEGAKAEWEKRSGSIRGQAEEMRARGRGGRGGTAERELRSTLRRFPES